MLEIRQVATLARWAALLITASILAACGQSSPVSGSSTAAASTQPASTTATLTLTGSPATSVNAGSAYTFQPSVSGTSGAVTFSITGTPAWATFNTATGELTGTPTSADVSTSGAITITASDGGTTASIGPFTIAVNTAAGLPPTGTATLTWVAPTHNTDGTPITGLAGIRIYYGTNAGALTQTIDVPGPTTTSFIIERLAAGTYYFAVAAYTAAGTESALSNIASKTT
jgi:hypothetical protein